MSCIYSKQKDHFPIGRTTHCLGRQEYCGWFQYFAGEYNNAIVNPDQGLAVGQGTTICTVFFLGIMVLSVWLIYF